MADFNALEALINAYIKQNGVKAITGNILNGVLRGMVSALGKGWTIADGDATPTMDPGTMTGPVAYIAHTAGTYEHFGNLVVNDGEVALLKYNEQTWTKEVIASLAATASVDGNVGTPAVNVTFQNGVLTFDFRNIKGATGDAAGFGTINATVDANIGTPAVSVQTSGPDTAKNMTFAFTNLKGETGVTSVVATVDNTVGTPSCAVSLVGQELHLDFTGLKGPQGDTGSSVDYPFTIVNNLTTNDATQALSAAMGVQLEGEISQLEHKVDGEITNVPNTAYTKNDGMIRWPGGTINTTAACWYSSPIQLLKGQTIAFTTQYQGQGAAISTTDSLGSSYTPVVPSSSAKSYSYTATQDTYVVMGYLKNGSDYREVSTCTITTPGISDKVVELKTEVNTLNAATLPSVKELVSGTDYSVNSGLLNAEGVVVASSGYWYSSPIAVHPGDVVYLKVTTYTGTGAAICRTNSTASYYSVLVKWTTATEYTITVDFEGYICIGYNAGRTPTQFTITSSSGGAITEKAKSYTNAEIAPYSVDLSSSRVDTNEERGFLSRLNAARRDALFEREKMLTEIAGMTNDDILVQGSCGYSESGGVVTDGTITWKIYKGGILYISGYGKFYDFIKGTSSASNIASVNSVVTTMGQHFWYYGFIAQNENGITTPFGAEGQTYEDDGDVFVYSNRRYVPFGENTNPLNNKPYGYAAPWYIYRTEMDWDYQPKSQYNEKNPTGIRYNRVCIDEDLDHGGITYIGSWTFYRLTAKSLVLPSKVTSVGCWGIRYSTVLETLIMGDLITTIEDHGVSRMESLRNLHISDTLTSIGYDGMAGNGAMEYAFFPDTTTSIAEQTFNECRYLTMVKLGSITSFPTQMFVNCPLTKLEIPDTVTSIGGTSVYNAELTEITIPANVTTIGNNAFRNCHNIKKVVIESPTIVSSFVLWTSEAGAAIENGYLLAYNDLLLIPSSIVSIPDYFYKYFLYMKDDGAYKYFVRNMIKAG